MLVVAVIFKRHLIASKKVANTGRYAFCIFAVGAVCCVNTEYLEHYQLPSLSCGIGG